MEKFDLISDEKLGEYVRQVCTNVSQTLGNNIRRYRNEKIDLFQFRTSILVSLIVSDLTHVLSNVEEDRAKNYMDWFTGTVKELVCENLEKISGQKTIN